jgi:hypothetical protein
MNSPESAAEFIARKRTQVGRVFHAKDIGRQGTHTWLLEAGTYRQQSNLPEKILAFERLRLLRRAETTAYSGGAMDGDFEYRIGYYIVARTGKRSGRWWWGQFAPFIPAQDFVPLLDQARSEGTLLD